MSGPQEFEGHGSGQRLKAVAAPAAMPPQSPAKSAPKQRRLLNLQELSAKLGVSQRKARGLIQEPWMPAPIELGPRAVRWVDSEVDEALAARAPRRSESASEPAELLRSRIERLKRGAECAA